MYRHTKSNNLTDKDAIKHNLASLIELQGICAQDLVNLCGVNKSTATRWINGTSCPSYAAYELIRLHAHQRIIPDQWPNAFRFQYSNSTFDVGGGIDAMSWQQLQYQKWLIGQHYRLLMLIPVLEGEIDELKRLLPNADIITLDTYRQRLHELANAKYDQADIIQLHDKTPSRLHGC